MLGNNLVSCLVCDWITSLRTSLSGGGKVIKFSDYKKPRGGVKKNFLKKKLIWIKNLINLYLKILIFLK